MTIKEAHPELNEFELSMNDIWVISWRYSDNSAFGLVRAYTSGERAKLDWEMLKHHAGDYKVFELTAIYLAEDERAPAIPIINGVSALK